MAFRHAISHSAKAGWLFLLLFFAVRLPAQEALCETPVALPFQAGEALDYSLVYHWGLVWLKAGTCRFSVRDTLVENERQWLFTGEGASLDSWKWFYDVSSTYQSRTDSSLTPSTFTRKGKEGSYIYDRHYDIYSPDSVHIYRNDPQKKAVDWKFSLKGQCGYDVVTAIYKMRSLPWETMTPGDSIPLNLILDGALYPTYVRYEGKRGYEDKASGRTIPCIVFKPNLIQGTIFREGERMEVYVTDDHRRIPLYIETDLIVGKARVVLSQMENILPKR